MPTVFFRNDLRKLKADFEAAPRKAVVFYHIHKTGGRTLHTALSKHFAPNSFRVSGPAEVDAFLKRLSAGELDADGAYFIHGHRARLVANAVAERMPVFGLTILRRPVEIIESDYSYQRTRHMRTELTQDEYLKQRPANAMMRYLGFKDYDHAARGLRRKLSFVAITEELSDSLRMLGWLLSLPPISHENQNVARPEEYCELDPASVPQILKNNLEDVMFYEHMAHRHATLKRQFDLLNIAASPTLMNGESSMISPAVADFNLETGSNRTALFLAGCALFADRRDEAMKFFNKAFNIDWTAFRRIHAYLKERDTALANAWLLERAADLRVSAGAEAVRMAATMEKDGALERAGR